MQRVHSFTVGEPGMQRPSKEAPTASIVARSFLPPPPHRCPHRHASQDRTARKYHTCSHNNKRSRRAVQNYASNSPVQEAGASSETATPLLEVDANGLQRLKLQQAGWSFWNWRGQKIHYIKAGNPSKPPVLLVHGFGASAYHWRYVIPELAKEHAVYAIDLLGFGFSSKPSLTYNGYRIWSDQLSDFVKQIMGGGPVILCGNSLGAYASLLTSAYHPEIARGLVLVNGAGRFDEVKAALEAQAEAGLDSSAAKAAVQEATGVKSEMAERNVSQAVQDAPEVQATSSGRSEQSAGSMLENILEPLKTMAKRTAVYFAFLAAKQPSRIRQVLKQVYVSQDNIDDDLVQSIVQPAQDSNAPDVFYRVITSEGESITSLLRKLKAPLLLLWGELDPWITPSSADRIQKLFPSADRVNIRAGHCPHDDCPRLFIPPLLKWVASIP